MWCIVQEQAKRSIKVDAAPESCSKLLSVAGYLNMLALKWTHITVFR